jgi:hypothetical protein
MCAIRPSHLILIYLVIQIMKFVMPIVLNLRILNHVKRVQHNTNITATYKLNYKHHKAAVRV